MTQPGDFLQVIHPMDPSILPSMYVIIVTEKQNPNVFYETDFSVQGVKGVKKTCYRGNVCIPADHLQFLFIADKKFQHFKVDQVTL